MIRNGLLNPARLLSSSLGRLLPTVSRRLPPSILILPSFPPLALSSFPSGQVSAGRLLTRQNESPLEKIERLESELARARAAEAEARAAEAEARAAEAKAVEEAARVNGKRWVLFDGLDIFPRRIGVISEPIVEIPIVNNFLRHLNPQNKSGKMMVLDQSKDLARKQPRKYFKTDIFGTPIETQHEIAHLVPNSRSRAELWNAILTKILGMENHQNGIPYKLKMLVEGFRNSKPGSIRKEGTGLIYQPMNHIAMAGQGTWLDRHPSVGFFPLLSLNQMLLWQGEPYEAIFVAADGRTTQLVGAIRGDFREWNGNDERVVKAFSHFTDAASLLLSLINESTNENPGKGGDESSMLMRKYLAKQHEFLAPSPNVSSIVKYRVVKFSPGKRLTDDENVVQGHPAPMPLLLVGKSLNAWLSHLLRSGRLTGFEFPQGYTGDRQFSSILPFCGVDASDSSCPVCLAKTIICGDPALEELLMDDADYERMLRIAHCEQVVMEVEDDRTLSRASSLLKVCWLIHSGFYFFFFRLFSDEAIS